MHISSSRLIVRNVRSTAPICRMQSWWLIHMIPIVMNETA